MGDWRDFEEGRRGLSLANLADGESMEVFIDSEPYLNEEEIEQPDGRVEKSESLRVPVVPQSVPDGFEDMNGDAVETAEVESSSDVDDSTPQYDIINSSTAFKKAMRDAYPGDVKAEGSTAEITAHQSDQSDTFSRTYSVDW